ncbi:fatty acid desaturase [Alisedimentitalea sp. MJ-SS2]|uniref:fatty acid desaturase n=1 Tax=Aliisedimentitalea sp. MJ-SS2 TaxID=3049795 RepID=UPI00290C6B72|nr:fatty acid desaturase [Alisedimentitalea sp. MJ-SS2]MDU8929800.1 fatty acid desaturase [Alisedimentitalea sp. MJ-SS2]
MTHDELLKSLPPDTRASLHEMSDAAGLQHLAGHLSGLAVTGAWIGTGAPLWWLALPLHGALLVFLFTLQHECTHKTPFASRPLNESVGHITGFVILQPFLWFRYFHLAHHRHTNDPDNDPELTAGAKPATRRAYLWHVSGLPVWSWLGRQMFENAFGTPQSPYLPARVLPRLRREARFMLAGYGLILLIAPGPAFWLWILPMMLGQPLLRLYLLAEHGRCPHVANMLENSRTTYTTRAIRFIAWNMPYHIEHHSAPNVPFHHLPELHRHMRDHLISTSQGYVAFTRDYVSTLEG